MLHVRELNAPQGGLPVRPLSKLSVDDVCALLDRMVGLSPAMREKYAASLRDKNISGMVLLHCDLKELKPEMQMTFGDWEIFRALIQSMRDQENNGINVLHSDYNMGVEDHFLNGYRERISPSPMVSNDSNSSNSETPDNESFSQTLDANVHHQSEVWSQQYQNQDLEGVLHESPALHELLQSRSVTPRGIRSEWPLPEEESLSSDGNEEAEDNPGKPQEITAEINEIENHESTIGWISSGSDDSEDTTVLPEIPTKSHHSSETFKDGFPQNSDSTDWKMPANSHPPRVNGVTAFFKKIQKSLSEEDEPYGSQVMSFSSAKASSLPESDTSSQSISFISQSGMSPRTSSAGINFIPPKENGEHVALQKLAPATLQSNAQVRFQRSGSPLMPDLDVMPSVNGEESPGVHI